MVMEWSERLYSYYSKCYNISSYIRHGGYLYSNHNRCQWVYEYLYNRGCSESYPNVYGHLQ